MNTSPTQAFSVDVSTKLYTVLRCIDKSGQFSLALVLNEQGQLITTITDGDLRRALLAGFSFENTVQDILPLRTQSPHPAPITAPVGMPRSQMLQLMQEQSIRQLPLIDEAGRVQEIVLLSDLIKEPELPLQALVMAGGAGMRLRPLTADRPKPMLTVGEKPLLEHIIRQLTRVGIRDIGISTHYMPEVITDFFGDGSAFGVNITYYHETDPLGTGGALGLMPVPDCPLLVVNGDILTQIDFRSMYTFHKAANAMLTLTVRPYSFQVPYGVILSEGEVIQGVSEKPRYDFLINAGIYLIQPDVYGFIPRGQKFNMTDLIQWLLEAHQKVVSFPIVEYWLDIGMHSDYARAQVDFLEGTFEHELDE